VSTKQEWISQRFLREPTVLRALLENIVLRRPQTWASYLCVWDQAEALISQWQSRRPEHAALLPASIEKLLILYEEGSTTEEIHWRKQLRGYAMAKLDAMLTGRENFVASSVLGGQPYILRNLRVPMFAGLSGPIADWVTPRLTSCKLGTVHQWSWGIQGKDDPAGVRAALSNEYLLISIEQAICPGLPTIEPNTGAWRELLNGIALARRVQQWQSKYRFPTFIEQIILDPDAGLPNELAWRFPREWLDQKGCTYADMLNMGLCPVWSQFAKQYCQEHDALIAQMESDSRYRDYAVSEHLKMISGNN
jgi:hypothetical protein